MRTLDSHVLLPAPARRRRSATTIVAKDTNPYVTYCGELASGDLLVVETPGFATPPGRLLRRSAGSFAVAAELPGVNAHADISPSGRQMLAAGPLWEGEHASCVRVASYTTQPPLQTVHKAAPSPLLAPLGRRDSTGESR